MHHHIDDRSVRRRRRRQGDVRRRTAAGLLGLAVAAGALAYPADPASAASVTVSGTVYRDLNNNGLQDAAEPGVSGVVLAAGAATTTTGSTGRYRLTAAAGTKVRASTGWYRSQCDAMTCATGPGEQQDFAVDDQSIVATARQGAVLDLGLVPDWIGGFPIPSRRTPNEVDVAATIDWAQTSGTSCARTSAPAERACVAGDVAPFLVQIYNEGTWAVSNPTARFDMPAGVTLESLTLASGNHPGVTAVSSGQPTSSGGGWSRQSFSLRGTLSPAGVAVLSARFRVGATATTVSRQGLDTTAPWPTAVTVTVTNPANDVEDESCTLAVATCARTAGDRQSTPDNADTNGFSVVAAATVPSTTVAATTTTVGRPPGIGGPTTTTTTIAPTTTTIAPTTTTIAPTTTTIAPTTTTIAPTTTTIAPTTTTTPVPPSCTVSAILVPSCGAWLGSSTPSADGKYDYARGLVEYEQVARSTPDIIHFYRSGSATIPNANDIAQSERTGKQRSLMLYNWKPSATLTWRQIANGGADANITTVANSLRRYPHQLFLAISHEPEDDVIDRAGSGMTPEDYADMYRHVVTKLRAAGVTNAVFIVNYMGFTGWSSIVDRLYPGNAYVDWISYDPYAHANESTFAELLNRPRASAGWPGFYEWATAKGPGKPIMLSEWGFDLQANPASPNIIVAGPDVLEAQFPMLKALVYWNSFTPEYTYRIDQPTAIGQAYGQAYARFAADEYFARTSTAEAP